MDRSRYNTRTAWGTYSEYTVDTPGFYQKKLANEPLPVHPYRWRRIDGVSPLGSTLEGPRTERDVTEWYSSEECLESGLLHTGHGFTGMAMPTRASLHRTARNQLLRKLNDAPINLGVALGEYRSTATLLTDAMQATRSLLRSVRGFKYSDAVAWLNRTRRRGVTTNQVRRGSRQAADAWLAFTYGVMPLIRDCQGALEVLTRPERKPRIRVSTFHQEPLRGTAMATVGPHTTQIDVDGFATARAELLFDVENPFAFELWNAGVTNILGTAWELVPYSFVVDWFVPVGNYLSSVQPPSGASLVRGFTYVKHRAATKRFTRSLPNHWYTWNTRGSSTEVSKDRIPLTSFPRFEFEVPDISLTKSQIASGIALLVQQVDQWNTGRPWWLRRY